MPTPGGSGRRNGMNPQLVSDALYTFNVDIVHECSPLYAAKSKRKVEIIQQKLTIRRAPSLGRSSVRTAREWGWKRKVDYQEEHIFVPFRLRPCRGMWLILLTDMYYPAGSYFGNT